ncbi:MAG TPA: nucleotidyltransferase [Thermomicrobiales bacterium]|jgi:hypothetical protein|nr:nucleotidyltransferase [Thermomicrobiales bacterium]
MAISESQLEKWGKRNQYDTAVRAHEDVRSAILNSQILLASRSPEIFLQGSYRNYTNISADSDVDIVIMSTMDWLANTDELNYFEEIAYHGDYAQSTYSLSQMRSDVTTVLEDRFGRHAVNPGNKAIRLDGEPGVRRAADIVVANEYRSYHSYSSSNRTDYTSGIYFSPLDGGEPIINYPKQHYSNGTLKQDSSGEWFKRTVRIFKNARNYLIDNDEIEGDIASSYFIQCLLYNVPDRCYGGGHRLNFDDVLEWLLDQQGDMDGFICQNGISMLFGSSNQQWNEEDAVMFLTALHRLNG